RNVLDDVSLTIRPGEHVAMVGDNGAGKTTLIKLLCRLYEPSSGRITMDGIDLREFKISELRKEISVIFQDYARYHVTARENIWFGDISLPADHERILEAARCSGGDQVIAGLPDGYETILGKMFEKGEELSMGEWQKVALARAFLRDSQIIILDEPTSSLDVKSEHEIIQRFRLLAAGQTGIIISHRLSTVRMVDRILVLENGRISENGSHDVLVRRNESYACLFEMQAQRYR
ncbi:ATP-binding cassette domain-containing protein, partial [bacterium]|nr:ATP-binding cassette domain-containing protein [bacterium]